MSAGHGRRGRPNPQTRLCALPESIGRFINSRIQLGRTKDLAAVSGYIGLQAT